MRAINDSMLGPSPHRVAIVGAGFGGLFAAKALRRADVEVTVIDRTNHHLFQPLLYQLATGILAQGDIAPSRSISAFASRAGTRAGSTPTPPIRPSGGSRPRPRSGQPASRRRRSGA